jgi:Cu-processing system permease protein
VKGVLAETSSTLWRLARRSTLPAATGLDLALLLYIAWLDPAESAGAALSAASVLGALTVLILSAGIVADDRAAGRLVLPATHPTSRAGWVLGRWLAVSATAVGVFTVASGVLLVAGSGPRPPAALALGWSAGIAFLAALAALAVALSCAFGSTAQLLTLVAVLALGAMPPQVAVHALGGGWAAAAARALWSALPTPWALGRLHEWALARGAPASLLAASLVAQTAVWLGAGARALRRAELGARSE